MEQEQDLAPTRPKVTTEHRRIGILWACCWYFDTEWLIGLMTPTKKGSRSCLDMFMRLDPEGQNSTLYPFCLRLLITSYLGVVILTLC